jgi:hypothetical protein
MVCWNDGNYRIENENNLYLIIVWFIVEKIILNITNNYNKIIRLKDDRKH